MDSWRLTARLLVIFVTLIAIRTAGRDINGRSVVTKIMKSAACFIDPRTGFAH